MQLPLYLLVIVIQVLHKENVYDIYDAQLNDIYCSVEDFPYTNQNASKVCKLYKEALDYRGSLLEAGIDRRDKWCFVYQQEETHLFSTDVKRYIGADEQSLFLYYGEKNNGRPDGWGVLFTIYSENLYGVTYMGQFADGVQEEYGIEIELPTEIENHYFSHYVAYEGEWENGLLK